MQKKKKSLLKRPKFQRGQPIEVEWNDHWGRLGWEHPRTVAESGAMLCKSIGYFVGYSPNGDLVMASSLDEQDQVNNSAYRLWSAVTSIRKLK